MTNLSEASRKRPQSPTVAGKGTIALGAVLVITGLFILLAAAYVWLLAPRSTPPPLREVRPTPIPVSDLVMAPVPTALPTLPPTYVPQQALNVRSGFAAVEAAAVLPESPSTISGEQLATTASLIHPSQPVRSQPVRVIIPAIEVDAPVQSVGLVTRSEGGQQYLQWAVPSGYAAGWHESSAPLGRPGNTVLNGHNNIHGAIFRDLVDLAVGEQIVLQDSQSSHVYQVTGRQVLEEKGKPLSVRYHNARFIEPTDDERLTIVSCWPYTTNTHRVVIIAMPVNDGDL